MTTEDLLEKVRRYPVQFICGAIVLACAVGYYSRMDVISGAEARLDDTLSRAERVDDNIRVGASLPEHLAAMRTFTSQLDDRLVRPSELAENLKYFYRLESETGVSLGDLRQAAPNAKRTDGALFAGVGYDLMLSGGFAQIVGFINQLECGERFYRLNSFSLQRGREAGQPSVMLGMNLELLGTP
ncbi:MAG TPA: hypothetical protein VGA56_00265 [Opitutaceae bacterium]